MDTLSIAQQHGSQLETNEMIVLVVFVICATFIFWMLFLKKQ